MTDSLREQLEAALDTIDSLEGRIAAFHPHDGEGGCDFCGAPWPCPAWQELNGGNE